MPELATFAMDRLARNRRGSLLLAIHGNVERARDKEDAAYVAAELHELDEMLSAAIARTKSGSKEVLLLVSPSYGGEGGVVAMHDPFGLSAGHFSPSNWTTLEGASAVLKACNQTCSFQRHIFVSESSAASPAEIVTWAIVTAVCLGLLGFAVLRLGFRRARTEPPAPAEMARVLECDNAARPQYQHHFLKTERRIGSAKFLSNRKTADFKLKL